MTEVNVVTDGHQSEKRTRGRPVGSGLSRSHPALRLHIWQLVRWEIAAEGAASIVAACRQILSRQSRIVVNDVEGRVLTILTEAHAATLRRWYQAAERERHLRPDTDFARQCQDWLDRLPQAAHDHAAGRALMRSLEFDSRAGKSAQAGNYVEITDKAERARDRARTGALGSGLKAPKTPRTT